MDKVMTDFLKLVIPAQYIERLRQNPLLEFKEILNVRTGVLSNKSIAEYKGLKFIIFENSKYQYAEIQGSLHKYINRGLHNANDFSLLDLLLVIIEINRKFQIPIETFKLSNIEFGVNIEPPIKSNTILNYLLYHLGGVFKDVLVRGGNYKQATHSNYFVKMYNKEIQYRGKFELPKTENMRIELKYIKMNDLKKTGLNCLVDLFNPTVLSALQSLLINAWSNTILFDKSINWNALNPHYRNTKRYQWSNPNYWLELNKQRRKEQKISYNNIVENHSDKIHFQMEELIKSKWDILVNNSLPINRIINEHFVTN